MSNHDAARDYLRRLHQRRLNAQLQRIEYAYWLMYAALVIALVVIVAM